jgi:hypothetical protein
MLAVGWCDDCQLYLQWPLHPLFPPPPSLRPSGMPAPASLQSWGPLPLACPHMRASQHLLTPSPQTPPSPPTPGPPSIPSCPLQDIAEALRRLPPEVIVARNQRLKRAMDLSLKHEKLPKELRDKQTPFDHYLLVGQGWGCDAWGCAWADQACHVPSLVRYHTVQLSPSLSHHPCTALGCSEALRLVSA